MPFTSPLYYIFLFFTALFYFQLSARHKPFCLLIASYLFYISFDPRYIVFILITTIVSYSCAQYMHVQIMPSKRRMALCFALGIEFIMLGTTKYWNNLALASTWFDPIQILVPLGISFYTFQTIGYLLDVYRREIPPEKDIKRYALFLSFFPHLLAGPIEPAQHFLPQIEKDHLFDLKNASFGIMLIAVGLFKKFLIAERLAPAVNLIFENPQAHHGLAVAIGAILARYQIYGDFSGYTDIALGSAQILGFRLSPNFNKPFFADSISEFWRRWHMSLSAWIRRYVFYPLVATPISCVGVHGLIFITFLVLGLWHGGTFNFLIYGMWHGFFVILDVKTRRLREQFYLKMGFFHFPRLLKIVNVLFTFLLIVVPPTIFFRASNFNTSLELLKNLWMPWQVQDLAFISDSYFLIQSIGIAVVSILTLEVFHGFQERVILSERIWNRSRWVFWILSILLIIVVLNFGYFGGESSFIYMKF